MNQKGFAKIILIVIVVVLISIAGYFVFIRKSGPITPSPKSGWKAVSWYDPENPILGFRFDDPTSWVEDSGPSERRITVASCPINSCDRMSFDVQIIFRTYTPDSNLPAGWTKTKVNVGGISADKVVKPTDTAILTNIDFMRGSDWYHLEFYTSNANKQQAEPIFNHILETFTFTVSQEQQTPAEYDLLKDIDKWTLTYQDKNTSAMVCSDGRKGNTGTKYVFTMTSGGYGEPPGDIDTPYQKVVDVLKNNGWQQCKAIGETEPQDTQGTSEVFIKNNKLIGIFRHYSMGVGNSLRVSIQLSAAASTPVSLGKMGYILLYRNSDEVNEDKIAKLTKIKEKFANLFFYATNKTATINTTDPVYLVQTSQEMLVIDSTGNVIDLQLVPILKKFYESKSDKFDFISIYTTFPLERSAKHEIVTQSVKGIGLPIFVWNSFGSNGILKGIDLMGWIDQFNSSDLETQINMMIGMELHEFGHQWCCEVGDAFRRGQAGARLEIIYGSSHFYPGLQSPWRELMGANEWVPNGDGTFRAKQYDNPPSSKYHPFHLYFMGLLPESEYGKQYEIYDAGFNPVFPTDFQRAVYYKSVSVNDIIAIEGEREVVDTASPTVPTNLVAKVISSSKINLFWSLSTDNVGIAGYKVFRNGVHITTTPTPGYSDTNLSPNTTYTYSVVAYDAAGNVSGQSILVSATTPPLPDTTPPAVSLSLPTTDSTVVSGTVTVSATALDNVGVVGVQFLLDGANLGAEDTTLPYSISWNTTQTNNGSHILTARARDAAGFKTTSAVVTVTVNNVVAQ